MPSSGIWRFSARLPGTWMPRRPLDCPTCPGRTCDLRNLLIHEYFGVSVAIIWETIARDLRPVRAAIRRELESS